MGQKGKDPKPPDEERKLRPSLCPSVCAVVRDYFLGAVEAMLDGCVACEWE